MLYNNNEAQMLSPMATAAMNRPKNQRHWWHMADRVGATASFLCAVHCALLPFVVALLPLLGLGFLADHRIERAFVLFAASLAAVSLGIGYRDHRRRLPFVLMVPGVVLMLAGIAVDMDSALVLHSVLVTCGGSLLATAHVINLRACHRYAHARGVSCAH